MGNALEIHKYLTGEPAVLWKHSHGHLTSEVVAFRNTCETECIFHVQGWERLDSRQQIRYSVESTHYLSDIIAKRKQMSASAGP